MSSLSPPPPICLPSLALGASLSSPTRLSFYPLPPSTLTTTSSSPTSLTTTPTLSPTVSLSLPFLDTPSPSTYPTLTLAHTPPTSTNHPTIIIATKADQLILICITITTTKNVATTGTAGTVPVPSASGTTVSSTVGSLNVALLPLVAAASTTLSPLTTLTKVHPTPSPLTTTLGLATATITATAAVTAPPPLDDTTNTPTSPYCPLSLLVLGLSSGQVLLCTPRAISTLHAPSARGNAITHLALAVASPSSVTLAVGCTSVDLYSLHVSTKKVDAVRRTTIAGPSAPLSTLSLLTPTDTSTTSKTSPLLLSSWQGDRTVGLWATTDDDGTADDKPKGKRAKGAKGTRRGTKKAAGAASLSPQTEPLALVSLSSPPSTLVALGNRAWLALCPATACLALVHLSLSKKGHQASLSVRATAQASAPSAALSQALAASASVTCLPSGVSLLALTEHSALLLTTTKWREDGEDGEDGELVSGTREPLHLSLSLTGAASSVSGTKRSRATMDDERVGLTSAALGVPLASSLALPPADRSLATLAALARRPDAGHGTTDTTAQPEPTPPTPTPLPPAADSLHTLLTQSLTSSDKPTIDTILDVDDVAVIERTARRLPPSLSLTLLECIGRRLFHSPQRAPVLVTWTQAVLHWHSASLSASPQTSAALAPLYAALEQRCEILQPLLRLEGRLDLIVRRGEAAASAPSGGSGRSRVPLVQHIEDGSDDEAEEADADGMDVGDSSSSSSGGGSDDSSSSSSSSDGSSSDDSSDGSDESSSSE